MLQFSTVVLAPEAGDAWIPFQPAIGYAVGRNPSLGRTLHLASVIATLRDPAASVTPAE